MIQVQHLTKRFGNRTVVRDLSFQVERGEVVALLGPNGAGKTTTMRILACYLQPTSGSVTIAGHDVCSNSLEARRRIGYLPENVPLYPELRVHEYLDYRARLKGLRGSRRRRPRAARPIAAPVGIYRECTLIGCVYFVEEGSDLALFTESGIFEAHGLKDGVSIIEFSELNVLGAVA